MRIYFTAPLNGSNDLKEEHQFIVKILKDLGHNVHADQRLKRELEEKLEDRSQAIKIYRELHQALKSSDLVFAEVSRPSLSVGHEISLGLELNKSVVALYQGKKKPRFLGAIPNEKLQVIAYKQAGLKKVLRKAIKKGLEGADVRFNFFITPQLLAYLDWIAFRKRIPRSVYLRGLIEQDLKKNREYQDE